MWGLEYTLLFGVPNNKIETADGRSRWVFPFLNREQAETHFEKWLETFSRWKRATAQPIMISSCHWKTEIAGATMELFPRPIELFLPIAWEAFEGLLETFHDPQMWSGDWPLWHRHLFAQLDHQDTSLNLWRLLGGWCELYGGQHSSRVDIALTDTAVVTPDAFYFAKSSEECMINGDYFCGVPDLIAEVLAPASAVIDRNQRLELYRKVGVSHHWLLDPVAKVVEVRQLVSGKYRLAAVYHAGDTMKPRLFPGENVEIAALFKTQADRWRGRRDGFEPEPIPEWLVPSEITLGLECFFLLGHPDRRTEIWNNRCPCVLAFGSATEAKARLRHFVVEACSWEGSPKAEPKMIAPDTEQAEVGRFRFTRTGRHIHLDVHVDGRKYRKLLEVWSRKDAWDWGEE